MAAWLLPPEADAFDESRLLSRGVKALMAEYLARGIEVAIAAEVGIGIDMDMATAAVETLERVVISYVVSNARAFRSDWFTLHLNGPGSTDSWADYVAAPGYSARFGPGSPWVLVLEAARLLIGYRRVLAEDGTW